MPIKGAEKLASRPGVLERAPKAANKSATMIEFYRADASQSTKSGSKYYSWPWEAPGSVFHRKEIGL